MSSKLMRRFLDLFEDSLRETLRVRHAKLGIGDFRGKSTKDPAKVVVHFLRYGDRDVPVKEIEILGPHHTSA